MKEKRFIEFAEALRLRCDQGFLETYERNKLFFPYGRIVRPRRLEERAHLALLHTLEQNDDTKQMALRRSKEYKPFFDYADVHEEIESGFGFMPPSCFENIATIMTAGHPILRSLRGDLTPGIVQCPKKRPFRAWKAYHFDFPGGFRLNRAEHFYGWWQVLELYELETINLHTENPPWRIQFTDDDKRFYKGSYWSILHRDINPPKRVDFDPYHALLDGIWPGAWHLWSDWIERAADFDWRSYASLQCYLHISRATANQEEWDRHLQRTEVAAKLLTDQTRSQEWTQLLRALCRFEDHLEKEERSLLRIVVHDIIRIVADLLSVAFNKTMRQLAMEHDGRAREGYYTGLCDLDGETVRPWSLLKVLNERYFLTDTTVRQRLEFRFEDLQGCLVDKLDPDCASSFIDTLSTVYNEPILLALGSYEKAEKMEQESSWKNQQLWVAIRQLLVATESETRRWFATESLYKAFEKIYPSTWTRRWNKFQAQYPCAKKGKLDTTEKFVDVLTKELAKVDKRSEGTIQRLDFHNDITFFARNWSAHNGKNPPLYTSRLASLVVTSAVRTLLIGWEIARSSNEYQQNLARIYPKDDAA